MNDGLVNVKSWLLELNLFILIFIGVRIHVSKYFQSKSI